MSGYDLLLSKSALTRFSHDLAGAVGAISSSLSLLAEINETDSEVLDLALNNANILMGRLRFFRAAFGNDGPLTDIATTKKIIEDYQIKGRLNFIIGTDAFEKIESWYRSDELKELVHFIVFPRGVELTPKSGYDYELAPMEFIDISSTELRKNHAGATIDGVKEYIDKNGLYDD